MAKKAKQAKAPKVRPRRERRFEPGPNARPGVVYALGAAGAVLMGGGAWEQFGPLLEDVALEPLRLTPYVLATGALLVGGAIWVGTSGESGLRVGDSGLAIEKGGVRRVAWYAVDRVEWRDEAVRVSGKDETGAVVHITAKVATHPQAAAWIVKEARARVPAAVDIPEDAVLPLANADAGEVLPLDPPQVVGRHCAASGKVISYEPDARLCSRCERVFHKDHVPEACPCGASLADVRAEVTPQAV